MKNYGRLIVGGNATLTINPGIYSQISISGNAHVTLRPGIYVVEGGGFSASGNASLMATGVTIYNVGSRFPSAGGTFGSISLGITGTIKLSPPSTGPSAGLLIVQPADNSEPLTFAGNATSGVRGLVYAPAAHLLVSGTIHQSTAIVVDTVSFNGNAPFGTPTSALGAGVLRHRAAGIRGGRGGNRPFTGRPLSGHPNRAGDVRPSFRPYQRY